MSLSVIAVAPRPASALAPEEVERLLEETAPLPFERRIEAIAPRFLGHPYVLGNLGEGDRDRYDRDPLYRFDVFDCTTLVETVLALAASPDLGAFAARIDRLRYDGGVARFTARNHFIDLDWIRNNARAGLLEDVTERVAGRPERVRRARALVDKPAWYAKLGLSAIVAPGLSEPERRHLLDELHAEGRAFRPEWAEIPFLPTELLVAGNEESREVLGRIPSGAVVNIVRPGWDLVEAIGTQMNVSHQGLAIRDEQGELQLIHASSANGKVARVRLVDYLAKLVGRPTIRGINVDQPLR